MASPSAVEHHGVGAGAVSHEIADLLDRLALIAQSVMDMGRPSDERSECLMCTVRAATTEQHDPDCAWRLARGLAQSDVHAVQRLARALRYERRPAPPGGEEPVVRVGGGVAEVLQEVAGYRHRGRHSEERRLKAWGAYVRDAMRRKGGLRALARDANVDMATLSRWATGTSGFTEAAARRVALAVGDDPAAVLTKYGPSTSDSTRKGS